MVDGGHYFAAPPKDSIWVKVDHAFVRGYRLELETASVVSAARFAAATSTNGTFKLKGETTIRDINKRIDTIGLSNFKCGTRKQTHCLLKHQLLGSTWDNLRTSKPNAYGEGIKCDVDGCNVGFDFKEGVTTEKQLNMVFYHCSKDDHDICEECCQQPYLSCSKFRRNPTHGVVHYEKADDFLSLLNDGGKQMELDDSDSSAIKCDVCSKGINKASALFLCTQCDFRVCENCFGCADLTPGLDSITWNHGFDHSKLTRVTSSSSNYLSSRSTNACEEIQEEEDYGEEENHGKEMIEHQLIDAETDSDDSDGDSDGGYDKDKEHEPFYAIDGDS